MTRDEVLRLAREAGVQAPGGPNWEPFVESLERFAALVAAAERYACAKVCDAIDTTHYPRSVFDEGFSTATAVCAEAIRARMAK